MGVLDIVSQDLLGEIVANEIGERTFEPLEIQTQDEQGFFRRIWDATKRFGGWLIGIGKAILTLDLSQVWGAVVAVSDFIWNFNWNISDKSLEQQIKGLEIAIAGQLGTTVGCAIGHLLGGAVAGALGLKLFKVDKRALIAGIKALSEEALEELKGNLYGLGVLIAQWAFQGAFMWIFKQARKFIKFLNNNTYGWLFEIFGIDEKIEKWGEEGGEPWVISEGIEEFIDNIESDWWRSFYSNFIEETGECFVEGGFVFAAGLDADLAARQDMREGVLGVQRTVELTFDRESPEGMLMSGRDQLIRNSLVNAQSTYYQLRNRDVGQWVGRQLSDVAQQQPALPSTLSLRIIWYPLPDPPFTRERFELEGNENLWTVQDITIPFINPNLLTWKNIKQAAGLTGYQTGEFKAFGKIGGRQLVAFGDSRQTARIRLKELAELSEAPLRGIRTSERHSEDDSDNRAKKVGERRPVRIFPAYGYLTAWKKELARSEGRATLQGNFSSRDERFELWTNDEPDYFKPLIESLKQYYTPLEQLGVGFTRG